MFIMFPHKSEFIDTHLLIISLDNPRGTVAKARTWYIFSSMGGNYITFDASESLSAGAGLSYQWSVHHRRFAY